MTAAQTNEPSAQFQLDFIEKMQRLLDSGSFVATYKYALLLALCNVAAEEGFDDSRPQVVPVAELGGQFLKIYWRHTRVYPGLGRPLRQNTGKPAAILTTVAKARDALPNPDRVDALGSVPERLLREATHVVREMPLLRLQTIGREKPDPDHPDNFLYAAEVRDRCITLRPGVSACLRRFRQLITSTTQAAWSDYVRRTNPELGTGHDLTEFLFGVDRVAVHQFAPVLLAIQDGRCFYTGRRLDTAEVHVDHFIPWSKYPMNSPFNLVLTSRRTNIQKSDHMAALPHLDHWRKRNRALRDELIDMGALREEQQQTLAIARYSYSAADRVGAWGWLQGRDMQELSGWQEILVA